MNWFHPVFFLTVSMNLLEYMVVGGPARCGECAESMVEYKLLTENSVEREIVTESGYRIRILIPFGWIFKVKVNSIINCWLSSENWDSASVKEVNLSTLTNYSYNINTYCTKMVSMITYGTCMYMQIECTLSACCFNFAITRLCTCCNPYSVS